MSIRLHAIASREGIATGGARYVPLSPVKGGPASSEKLVGRSLLLVLDWSWGLGRIRLYVFNCRTFKI